MMYNEYPELSDDQETATRQVERAREVINNRGFEEACRLARKGRLQADALEIAMGHLEAEIDLLRESSEYREERE